MVSECKQCGKILGEEHPQLNGSCIECIADAWGDLVDKSPMISPQSLLKVDNNIVSE